MGCKVPAALRGEGLRERAERKEREERNRYSLILLPSILEKAPGEGRSLTEGTQSFPVRLETEAG